MVVQTFAQMTKLFVEDGCRLRHAMGVCLAGSAPPLYTAVGGSTGGIGAVRGGGRQAAEWADLAARLRISVQLAALSASQAACSGIVSRSQVAV